MKKETFYKYCCVNGEKKAQAASGYKYINGGYTFFIDNSGYTWGITEATTGLRVTAKAYNKLREAVNALPEIVITLNKFPDLMKEHAAEFSKVLNQK